MWAACPFRVGMAEGGRPSHASHEPNPNANYDLNINDNYNHNSLSNPNA